MKNGGIVDNNKNQIKITRMQFQNCNSNWGKLWLKELTQLDSTTDH